MTLKLFVSSRLLWVISQPASVQAVDLSGSNRATIASDPTGNYRDLIVDAQTQKFVERLVIYFHEMNWDLIHCWYVSFQIVLVEQRHNRDVRFERSKSCCSSKHRPSHLQHFSVRGLITTCSFLSCVILLILLSIYSQWISSSSAGLLRLHHRKRSLARASVLEFSNERKASRQWRQHHVGSRTTSRCDKSLWHRAYGCYHTTSKLRLENAWNRKHYISSLFYIKLVSFFFCRCVHGR